MEKVCPVCNKTFNKRKDAVFCGGRCKLKEHRRLKALAEEKAAKATANGATAYAGLMQHTKHVDEPPSAAPFRPQRETPEAAPMSSIPQTPQIPQIPQLTPREVAELNDTVYLLRQDEADCLNWLNDVAQEIEQAEEDYEINGRELQHLETELSKVENQLSRLREKQHKIEERLQEQEEADMKRFLYGKSSRKPDVGHLEVVLRDVLIAEAIVAEKAADLQPFRAWMRDFDTALEESVSEFNEKYDELEKIEMEIEKIGHVLDAHYNPSLRAVSASSAPSIPSIPSTPGGARNIRKVTGQARPIQKAQSQNAQQAQQSQPPQPGQPPQQRDGAASKMIPFEANMPVSGPPVKKPKRHPQPALDEIGAGDLMRMKFESFQLPGALGQFLGRLDRNKTCVALTGDSGAGKTFFAFQVAKLFIHALRIEAIMFSLEEGIGRITQEKVREYDLGNDLRIKSKGTIHDVRKAAEEYPLVIVDSFTKLNTKTEEFEKLRTDFPKTIFLLIFQKTTAGTMRGGSAIKYDSSATINVAVRDGHRIAIMEKGRYGTNGWEYDITEDRIIKQQVA